MTPAALAQALDIAPDFVPIECLAAYAEACVNNIAEEAREAIAAAEEATQRAREAWAAADDANVRLAAARAALRAIHHGARS